MTRLLPLALALACTGGTGVPAGEGRAWTGWERRRFGDGATIEDLNCDLHFRVTGTEASHLCRECEFSFEVAVVFDDDASVNDGSCSYAAQADLVYGFVDDWEGNGPMLGTVESGDFVALAPATWADATGVVTYRLGNLGYASSSYYYVDYFEGYGVIGEDEQARPGGVSGGDDTGDTGL